MIFLREHLSGFYEWIADSEQPVFDGNASRRLFNRWNGNQVLFLINLLLSSSGNSSIERGRDIERLIINELPLTAKSELTVFNWLQGEIAKAKPVQQT